MQSPRKEPWTMYYHMLKGWGLQLSLPDHEPQPPKALAHKSGHLQFLTFTDLYRLDTDILITFLSILRIYTDLYAPKV